ncbi:MAG: NAD(P)H-binding protein [bacterium]
MRLFLTGATGFVGRAFLRRLPADRFESVTALVRDPAKRPELAGLHSGVRLIPGDLTAFPAAAREAAAAADVVLHLAATTGKARAAEHERVIVDGTRALLEAVQESRPRFVHVSTIAATYPELDHYPYGRAKRDAEALVRASGLDWAILRPTIVFGPGSPVGRSLRSLASAPVLPRFGGGHARMHPVHVDDVAEVLVRLLAADPLGGRTIDFGGRDVVTFREFLERLRTAIGRGAGPAVSIPVRPLIGTLAALERVAGDALPVAAGQFYAFAHDGVAAVDAADSLVPPQAERRGVQEIVSELATPATPDSAFPDPAPADETLAREARLFTRHLIGREPPSSVMAKYSLAHAPGRHGPGGGDHDRLVLLARRGTFATRLADAWAAVFDRGGVLRRKLVLLLAILESTGETAAAVDTPDSGGAPTFFLRAARDGIVFVATLVFAAPFVWGSRRR